MRKRKLIPPIRYLSDYPHEVLNSFFGNVDVWEKEIVTKALASAHAPTDPLVYHILSNLILLENEPLFNVAETHHFSSSADSLPPTPIGVLSMLVDSRHDRRLFATRIRRSFRALDETAHASVALVSALFRRVDSSSPPSASASLNKATLQAPALWDYLPPIISNFTTDALSTHFTGKLPVVNMRRITISNLAGTTSESPEQCVLSGSERNLQILPASWGVSSSY